MENYIITVEDGEHYLAHDLTDGDISANNDGLITIIRTSDLKMLIEKDWESLLKWE